LCKYFIVEYVLVLQNGHPKFLRQSIVRNQMTNFTDIQLLLLPDVRNLKNSWE
jgi:hypothetical protein